MDLYQDFTILGNKLRNVFDVDNVRWPESGIDGRFHDAPLGPALGKYMPD